MKLTNDCVICTMNSNEIDICEWIVHHLLLGFKHIFIYDDHAEPPVQEIVDTLPKEFSDKVTCYRLDATYEINNEDYEAHPRSGLKFFDASLYKRFKYNKQKYLMNYFLKHHRNVARFCLFSDIDEFIYLKTCKTITEFLDKMFNYDIITLTWAYYGTSYYADKPPGLVVDNFRFTNGYTNSDGFSEQKCIVKLKNVSEMECIHSYYNHEKCNLLSQQGKYFIQKYDNSTPFGELEIHINHYITKSYRSGLIKKSKHCLGQTNEFNRTTENLLCMCLGLDKIKDKHIMEKYVTPINKILNYKLNDNHNRFDINYTPYVYINNKPITWSWVKNNKDDPDKIQEIIDCENLIYK